MDRRGNVVDTSTYDGSWGIGKGSRFSYEERDHSERERGKEEKERKK